MRTRLSIVVVVGISCAGAGARTPARETWCTFSEGAPSYEGPPLSLADAIAKPSRATRTCIASRGFR
jgi:hypothetical protein